MKWEKNILPSICSVAVRVAVYVVSLQVGKNWAPSPRGSFHIVVCVKCGAEWAVSGAQSIQSAGIFINHYRLQDHLWPGCWGCCSPTGGDGFSNKCITSPSGKRTVHGRPSLDWFGQLTISGQRQLIRTWHPAWWPQHIVKDVLHFYHGTTSGRFDMVAYELGMYTKC